MKRKFKEDEYVVITKGRDKGKIGKIQIHIPTYMFSDYAVVFEDKKGWRYTTGFLESELRKATKAEIVAYEL